MDHIGLDHQVLIDELGRVAIIRPDPADLGRGEIDPSNEGVRAPM